MGQFLFDIPDHWSIKSRQAGSIHIVGLDGIPWPCKVNMDGTTLVIQRNRDESGRVFITFPFSEYGELVISTGTLPESSTPYCLVTELARGTANRLRNQTSIWQEGGLVIDDEVHQATAAATKFLGTAIMAKDKSARVENAWSAIEKSMQAIFLLCQDFASQIVPVRKAQASSTTFWFANRTGKNEQFEPSLNASVVDLVQVPGQVTDFPANKPLIVGPFLDASPQGFSSELLALDDFAARKASTLATTQEVMNNLPDSVKMIHAVSGINGTGHRNLSYPQQLQLIGDLLQTVEDSSTDLPIMISFDFPWAERLAWSVGGTHPLQIADGLLRRGLRISMLGLEINLDYWPQGSIIRDPLQWIELIDIWSQLGLPLAICLRAPSGKMHSLDPEKTRVGPSNMPRMSMNDEQQRNFLNTVIPMIIARPTVHGIIWNQWSDSDNSHFAGAGLVDANGQPKEILDFWASMRALMRD